MVKVITDGVWAYEDVWGCWLTGESCAIRPRHYPDPSKYLDRYQGPPALFQYVANAYGGYDLLPFEYTLFDRRWAQPLTPAHTYMDVTWAILDNNIGYGLTFGRLYPKWLGKKVIPFTGIRGIAETIDSNGVTCVICDANFLADYLTQDPPKGQSLRAVINICRRLAPAKADAIEQRWGVPVFTTLGDHRMGLVTWDRAKDMLLNSWGTFMVPTEQRGKETYVKPPVPWGETEKHGWVKLEL